MVSRLPTQNDIRVRIPSAAGYAAVPADKPVIGDPGAGLQRMAAGFAQAGALFERADLEAKRKAEQDAVAAAAEAEIGYENAIRPMLHDPEQGYFAAQGRNALDRREPTRADIEKTRALYGSKLTGEARRRFDLATRDSQGRVYERMDGWARQQRAGYLNDIDQAQIQSQAQEALQYADDDEALIRAVGEASLIVERSGQRNGDAPEVIRAKQLSTRSAIMAATVGRLIENGDQKSLQTAVERFRNAEPYLSDTQRGQTLRALRGAQVDYAERVFGADVDAAKKAMAPVGSVAGRLPRSDAARGLRNNNPGNIEFGDYAESKGAGRSDGRFAIFETPEQGIAAMGDLLKTYQRKHGLESVREMIGRWAPAGDGNNVSAYARSVADAAGVDPDAPVNMNDPAVAARIVAGMIRHENGANPYSVEQIAAVLSGGKSERAPADPALSGLTKDERDLIMKNADRLGASNRLDDDHDIKNRLTQMMLGLAADRPDPETERRRYGSERAAELAADYDHATKIGGVAQMVRNGGPEELGAAYAEAEAARRDPEADDTADRQQYFEVLTQAMQARAEAIDPKSKTRDPVGFVTVGDKQAAAASEAFRGGDVQALRKLVALNMSAQDVREIPEQWRQPLSRADADFLGEQLANLPPEQLGPAVNAYKAMLGRDSWAPILHQMVAQKSAPGDILTFSRFADKQQIARFLRLGFDRKDGDAAKNLPEDVMRKDIDAMIEAEYVDYRAALGAGDVDLTGLDMIEAEVESVKRSAYIVSKMNGWDAQKTAKYATDLMLSEVSVARNSDVLAYAPSSVDPDALESAAGLMKDRMMQDSTWVPQRYAGVHPSDEVNRNVQMAMYDNSAVFITNDAGDGVELAVPLYGRYEVVVDADNKPYGFLFSEIGDLRMQTTTPDGLTLPNHNLTLNPELESSPFVRSE